jgi:hypothetical protein
MIVRQANPESRWGFHARYQYCFIINGAIFFRDRLTTIGVFND